MIVPRKSNHNTNGHSKTQSTADTLTLHLRLSPITVRRLRKQASEMERTMHWLARKLMDKAVEEHGRVGAEFFNKS